jgi:hypothetical protein
MKAASSADARQGDFKEIVLSGIEPLAACRSYAVIAKSAATKQSILSFCGTMDCFASLAMTGMEQRL